MTDEKMDWWTDAREKLWNKLNHHTQRLWEQHQSNRRQRHGTSSPCVCTSSPCVCAPNPDNIIDDDPDEWYISISTMKQNTLTDVEALQTMLEDKLEVGMEIKERPENWSEGYWIVIPHAERDLM